MASDRDGSEFWAARLKREPPGVTIRAVGAALALAADSRFTELEALYRAARSLGAEPSALVEGALSAHLFSGFPRAIEAFAALHAAFEAPPAREDPRDRDRANRDGRGLFASIYGKNDDLVLRQLERFSPDFARAVIEDAYGRILTRSGLDGRTRELAAVCALASLGLERQLFSHVRGALALGAGREEIEAMVELAAEITPATAIRARETTARAVR